MVLYPLMVIQISLFLLLGKIWRAFLSNESFCQNIYPIMHYFILLENPVTHAQAPVGLLINFKNKYK